MAHMLESTLMFFAIHNNTLAQMSRSLSPFSHHYDVEPFILNLACGPFNLFALETSPTL
jgi:hypothetical protein